MSDDIFNSLKDLKNQLDNLESSYINNKKINEKKIIAHLNLDKKLDDLASLQNDKIIVETGRKQYQISKKTIKKCKLRNILRDEIEKYEKNNENLITEKIPKYFIDISSKTLKLFLDIIRYFCNNGTENKEYIILINEKMEEELLKKEIEYFFIEENIFKYIKLKSSIRKNVIIDPNNANNGADEEAYNQYINYDF